MSHFAYLLALCLSFGGILAIDLTSRKSILEGRRTFIPILASFCLLLAADVAGIALNVFHTNARFVTGVHFFTPDLPLEEFLLLLFLPYLVIVISDAFRRKV